MRGDFKEHYDPTLEDSYNKDVVVDGCPVSLEILDTAGQEEYSELRETFMDTGDGFMLVFSVADDSTFEALREIRDEILRAHPDPSVPFLLVGNKCDLESKRAVTREEARRMASQFRCEYLEISAKMNVRVGAAFDTVLRLILDSRKDARGTGADHDPDAEKVNGRRLGGMVLGAGTTRSEDRPRVGRRRSLPRIRGKKCIVS